jgi:hypothetical protein
MAKSKAADSAASVTDGVDAATTGTSEVAAAEECEKRITACLRRNVEGVFEIGRLLIEAKDKLLHGDFLPMIERVGFKPDAAQRHMAIAKDARLNAEHVRHLLPASWGTLYELTKLEDGALADLFANGTIRPDMYRRDIGEAVERRQVRIVDERINDVATALGRLRGEKKAEAIEKLIDLMEKAAEALPALMRDKIVGDLAEATEAIERAGEPLSNAA